MKIPFWGLRTLPRLRQKNASIYFPIPDKGVTSYNPAFQAEVNKIYCFQHTPERCNLARRDKEHLIPINRQNEKRKCQTWRREINTSEEISRPWKFRSVGGGYQPTEKSRAFPLNDNACHLDRHCVAPPQIARLQTVCRRARVPLA